KDCVMKTNRIVRSSARFITYVTGLAAGLYAARAAATWLRYGRVKPSGWGERDAQLDCFMPVYEVADRHHIDVEAPADVTFATLSELDLERCGLVNAIFKARALILGSTADRTNQPRHLLESVQELGWRILAEQPGVGVVLGAGTRPWEADVVFRGIPSEQFAGFDEPNYVKIVWTLRADPIGEHKSIARTETRAIATDDVARAKFRRYWSVFSPGIVLIRRAMLADAKREAERRAFASIRDGRDRFARAYAGGVDSRS